MAASTITGIAAGPSQAAGPIACPTALPTSEAVSGLAGTGYTVERGTVPAPFEAEILGRLTDGIAPGVDMIMAELSSPALDKAGGVWAGMSGSPVYTEDGELIGAVAYGLGAGSNIAGLTPAEEMLPLAKGGTATAEAKAAAAAGKALIKVPTATAKRLAVQTDVTAAQASAGFRRLALPLAVSGAGNASADKLLAKLAKKASGVRMLAGGGTATASEAQIDIAPGSNFTAALSYGSITLAGTGTTTAVCDGVAVAFGHPMLWTGKTQLSMHGSTAITVQDDLVSPYKLANPGGVSGVVDGDRLAGIRGPLGATPANQTAVTLRLNGPDGRVARTSSTAVYTPWLGDVAAYQTLYGVQRALDSDAGGLVAYKLTITGTRANGSAFSVTRTDRISTREGIAYAAADTIYGIVNAVANQEHEKVAITAVSITGTAESDAKQAKVSSLQRRSGSTWVSLANPVPATSGGKLPVRLNLRSTPNNALTSVPVTLAVPSGTAKRTGTLTARAGNEGFYVDPAEYSSFSALLSAIANTPRSDAVSFTLQVSGKPAVTVKSISGVPFQYPYERAYSVRVG